MHVYIAFSFLSTLCHEINVSIHLDVLVCRYLIRNMIDAFIYFDFMGFFFRTGHAMGGVKIKDIFMR